jgi:hypothetical protein
VRALVRVGGDEEVDGGEGGVDNGLLKRVGVGCDLLLLRLLGTMGVPVVFAWSVRVSMVLAAVGVAVVFAGCVRVTVRHCVERWR